MDLARYLLMLKGSLLTKKTCTADTFSNFFHYMLIMGSNTGKNPKKNIKKTFLVGFFRWVYLFFFLGGIFGRVFNANPVDFCNLLH
jgi:hypothetical protein